MRQRILTLGLILVVRTLVAQEAVYRASTGPGQNLALPITAPVSGNAWIDLRQNAKPGAVQSAPDWVEAVTFIPAGTQADAAAPTVFRIRLARPGGRASVLFFRLFFNDQTGARPAIVAWDESGSQLLRSGPLGTGIDLESSESVMIPMHGRIWYRHRPVVDGFDPHRLDFERGCHLRIRVGIATLACPHHFRNCGPAH